MNLKSMCNTPQVWGEFNKVLDKRIGYHHRNLEQVSTIEDVKYIQGHIACLKLLKKLRDELNNDDTGEMVR